MKKVITYGTFDLFHFGHLELLRRAKELGDHLVVAVSTDKFNVTKGKKCVYNYEHRSKIVAAIKYVDRVIPEKDWRGKFDELSDICKIVYIERTKGISTRNLKENIANRF